MSTEQDQINEYDELVDTDPLALRDRAIALHMERDQLKRGGAELGKTLVVLNDIIKDAFRLGADDPIGGLHILGNHLAEILPGEGGLDADEHNRIYRALEDRRRSDAESPAAVQRVSAYLDALIANGFGATGPTLRALRAVLGQPPAKEQDRETRERLLYELLDLAETPGPAGGSEEKEDPTPVRQSVSETLGFYPQTGDRQ